MKTIKLYNIDHKAQRSISNSYEADTRPFRIIYDCDEGNGIISSDLAMRQTEWIISFSHMTNLLFRSAIRITSAKIHKIWIIFLRRVVLIGKTRAIFNGCSDGSLNLLAQQCFKDVKLTIACSRSLPHSFCLRRAISWYRVFRLINISAKQKKKILKVQRRQYCFAWHWFWIFQICDEITFAVCVLLVYVREERHVVQVIDNNVDCYTDISKLWSVDFPLNLTKEMEYLGDWHNVRVKLQRNYENQSIDSNFIVMTNAPPAGWHNSKAETRERIIEKLMVL